MYRYCVDNAVTYTPDDLVLFRESPFALWMERLTLENPDHGILPDINSSEPVALTERQDYMVDTLREEGRDVVLIDWDLEEPERRAATVAAMRAGADFIVNGLLALGPLAGTANLLMRTSGYSELGDFLYVPCDTQSESIFESGFRLCFLADLLQHLQGQLPPQMLVIRGDADVVPLKTEDHIHYYRAVKKRCMDEMDNFRKHRMPDPTESSHFGRWSECASEVLKQRALGDEAKEQQTLEEQARAAQDQQEQMLPERRVAGMGGQAPTAYQFEDEQPAAPAQAQASQSVTHAVHASATPPTAGQTLAEQARLLESSSFKVGAGPGHTPNLARFGRPRAVAAVPDAPKPAFRRRSSDIALQNLEFIGSVPEMPFIDTPPPQEPCAGLGKTGAPPSALRHASPEEAPQSAPDRDHTLASVTKKWPDMEPPEPRLMPPDQPLPEALSQGTGTESRHPPAENASFKVEQNSLVDLDSAPSPALRPIAEPQLQPVTESPVPPLVERASVKYEQFEEDPWPYRQPERKPDGPKREQRTTPPDPFSDSLNTGDHFDDT